MGIFHFFKPSAEKLKARQDAERAHHLIQNKEWDKVVEIGQPAVKLLMSCLRDNCDDLDIFVPAVRTLGKLGDASAVKPLIEALKDGEWNVQREAVIALGKIGDSRAVEPLIKVLKSGDGNLRGDAVGALGKIGEPAVWPLIEALEYEYIDERSHVLGLVANNSWEIEANFLALMDLQKRESSFRGEVIRALMKIGEPAVWPLTKTLKNQERDVRCCVADTLGNIGDERAVGPLTEALRDEDDFVRESVKKALEKIKAKKG